MNQFDTQNMKFDDVPPAMGIMLENIRQLSSELLKLRQLIENKNEGPDGYMSIEQAAVYFNLSECTIREKCRKGKIKGATDKLGPWRIPNNVTI